MDTVDRLAMVLSSTLLLTGIVVLGVVELLDGAPYGAAPLTNEAGAVVAQPGIDPTIRTGLVVAGLVVLGLWAGYRAVVPIGTDGQPSPTRRRSDSG